MQTTLHRRHDAPGAVLYAFCAVLARPRAGIAVGALRTTLTALAIAPHPRQNLSATRVPSTQCTAPACITICARRTARLSFPPNRLRCNPSSAAHAPPHSLKLRARQATNQRRRPTRFTPHAPSSPAHKRPSADSAVPPSGAPRHAGSTPPARPRAVPAGSHERRGGVPADHAGARARASQTLASRCSPAPGLTRQPCLPLHRWCSSSSRRLRRRPTRSPWPPRRRAPVAHARSATRKR